jgi:2-polyprenyl-3-methyl-5-hydroxy-6-metoxy-1,4-benzoquinol methylase
MQKFPELICPIHRLPLQEDGDKLVCAQNHRYDLRSEIPRLLASEQNYAVAFGQQWNQYRLTQLDSYTNTSISEDRLRRCLGQELADRLSHGRVEVLETGCGAGRFTEILLKFKGAVVTSTDLSSAVEANQINCPQSDRHRIIQCDINYLPFSANSFDVVVCLGVIQHTRNPELTIADLYNQVKPGGALVIDHYTPSISHYTKVTALILRPIMKRLPLDMSARLSEQITGFFFPLHRFSKNKRFLQIVLSRFSPLLTYYQELPQLSDQLQYEWAMLDSHDSLTDYYKHLRTVSQISAILVALGAVDVRVTRGGNGVEARCRKPSFPQEL